MREKQQEKSNGSPTNSLIGSMELKRNLLKILQQGSTDSGDVVNDGNDLDSLVGIDGKPGVPITNALVERLVAEFLALKNTTNSVELQLYEANEKIAELVEHVSDKIHLAPIAPANGFYLATPTRGGE